MRCLSRSDAQQQHPWFLSGAKNAGEFAKQALKANAFKNSDASQTEGGNHEERMRPSAAPEIVQQSDIYSQYDQLEVACKSSEIQEIALYTLEKIGMGSTHVGTGKREQTDGQQP